MHKKIARKGFIVATTAVSIRPGKDDLLLGIIPACSSGKGEDITAVNTQNVLEYWVKQKTLLSLQRFPAEVEHLPTNFSRARVKGELKLLMKKVLRQAQSFSIST